MAFHGTAMSARAKRFAKGLLPGWILAPLQRLNGARIIRKGRVSFAQEGEDLILARLFDGRGDRPGYYVDVGAFHPFEYSNSYLFYLRGWRGIAIEPNPELVEVFHRARPRDRIVNCAVGKRSEDLIYYMMNEPALNTLIGEKAKRIEREHPGKYRVVREITVQVRPLASVLAEFVPSGQELDFMTIDAEGYDLVVLQSNDWTRFRPEFLLVEISGRLLTAATISEVSTYLDGVGYDLVGKSVHTAFFQRRDPDGGRLGG